jgi:hypothetical protein
VDGLGNSGGGNVTFLVAPANLSVVTRLRKQAASQLSDYLPNESFPAERIELDLDKLAMQVQQDRERIGRALKFKPSSSLVDQPVDDFTVGSYARAKVGGGIEWAIPSLLQITTGLYITSVGGTANAITLTPTPAIGAYANGQEIQFTAISTNTGAVTVAVSGLAAKAITKNGSQPLTNADIRSGMLVDMVYDGARFVMVATSTEVVATGSNTARLLADRFAEMFNVLDYGVRGSAAIIAAIAAAKAAGGGTVYVPNGNYPCTATITIDSSNMHLKGESPWGVILTRSTDYGDTITITGNDGTGTKVSDISIENITCESTGLTTSGAHIHCKGLTRLSLDKIYLQDGFIGFLFEACSQTYVSNIHAIFSSLFGGVTTGRRTLMVQGNNSYSESGVGGFFMKNFNLRSGASPYLSGPEYVIMMTTGNGNWFSNGHVQGGSNANIHLANTDAVNRINLVFFDNVMSDETVGVGVKFTGSATVALNIYFTSMMIKAGGASGTSGISVEAGAKFYNVRFATCDVIQFSHHGVDLKSADSKNVTFSNCSVRANGDATPNLYSGYKVEEANGLQIIGGNVGGGNNVTAETQKYGISVEGGTNIIISNVDLTNNVTGSIGNFTSTARPTSVITGILSTDSITVASADQIDAPFHSTIFHVSGTATINSLRKPWIGGWLVTMIFDAAATVTEAGNIDLVGAASFVATANDTLTLAYDGTTGWVEVARSVN